MTARGFTLDLMASVRASLLSSLERANRDDAPFRHWMLTNVFPPGLSEALRRLPFSTPHLEGVSGKRELHNDQRHYFDAVNNVQFNQKQLVFSNNPRSLQLSGKIIF